MTMREETLTLLGYQRAEHEVAERRQSAATKIEVAILVVALAALLAPNGQYALVAALASLLLAAVWQILNGRSRRSHELAERARRAVVLDSGLGQPLVGKAYSDLHAAFTPHPAVAKAFEDADYYTSTHAIGHERLADILEESAYWSKHLYKASAVRAWILLGAFLAVAISCLVLLAMSPFLETRVLGANSVCVILAWIVTGSELNDAIAYSMASRSVDDLEARLASTPASTENLLIELGDYNAVVQSAPTIPSAVYRRKQSELQSLWQQRKSGSE